ncbi:YjbF family lipoprotein [Roseovarius autotrophicus]|uniref:YjbF family lipoprotein n=1 Tax=Roseovarius autotrophicus TaxID=2824121 RepID=UPI0019ED088F|nr:YjbF family lipoprotein [Roseovarius autotrophicus]MBE0453704.1 YjbF family lipoprotein [Roseovarius sp.]
MIGRFPLRAGGAALVAALALGGCDRALSALDLTGNVVAVQPQLIGEDRLDVTIPASGARARLGPVARTGDVMVWQTLDGITLSMRQGLLIGTRGLGDDLMSAEVDGVLALLRGAAGEGPVPHIRTHLDGEDRTVFRSYQCIRGAVTRDAGLRRVEVLCVSPQDRFANTYWMDSMGAVIRSHQWISPALRHLETAHVSG